jgi:ribosomal-protein-alanine acetyltransferase
VKPALRAATPADLPAILALEERAFASDRFNRRQFRYLLRQARSSFLVARAGHDLLGYGVVLYRAHSRRARLYTIAVAEAARGRGLASALITALAAEARRRGCRQLGLEVRADNIAARGLYEKLGFRVVDTLAGYYEDGTAGLRMTLSLELTAG